MKKSDIQAWIDAWDSIMVPKWTPSLSADHELFVDPNYHAFRKYLNKHAKLPTPAYPRTIPSPYEEKVNLARELIKMSDEEWDLFVLSGFKYYKRKK